MPINERASYDFESTEKVYHGGALVSTRYPISHADSGVSKQLLTSNFPSYTSWITKYNRNLIGSAGAYRSPYTDNHVTLYVFESPPSDIITEFGVDVNLDFCTWFGFKFILSSGEVKLKVPFYDENNYYSQPDFPERPLHFANIYSSTTGLHNQRDAYFTSGGKKTFEQYFTTHSLTNPWPSEDVYKTIGLWSICYDTTTLVPDHVKAYAFE